MYNCVFKIVELSFMVISQKTITDQIKHFNKVRISVMSMFMTNILLMVRKWTSYQWQTKTLLQDDLHPKCKLNEQSDNNLISEFTAT